MTLYLDANATTPLDPRVRQLMIEAFERGPMNAGSPHRFGRDAKKAVNDARDQIAQPIAARRHEVIFTSGATESNNLAILGLAEHGRQTGKKHLVSTSIEHKAVLEPLQYLATQGFELTLIKPEKSGAVTADAMIDAVRDDTLLVSLMQVNNETGVRQPVSEIAARLPADGPWFHVDAAQGYGKEFEPLTHPRIDLISVSSHKIHGPQGVGALVTRRRHGELPPLQPLFYGGGQELGLRAGTLPVALILGFGLAAEIAATEHVSRASHCRQLRGDLLEIFAPLQPVYHGEDTLPHVVNVSFDGWDADQLLESLDDLVAVSDGAACTTVCATASHVLAAMGVTSPKIDGAVRISWHHGVERAAFREALVKVRERLLLGPVGG
ncbi:cysteine desulfurase family protein [Lacunimicrobium album]